MEVERREEKEMLRLLDNDASKAMEKIINRYGSAVKTICRSILLEYSNEDNRKRQFLMLLWHCGWQGIRLR